MGEIHQLVLRHGVDAARTMVSSKAERYAIDAAAMVLSEEESRLGITHAGFAMTSLPHKQFKKGFGREKDIAQRYWLNLAGTGKEPLLVFLMALSPA